MSTRLLLIAVILIISIKSLAQSGLIYERLPLGKFPVGFKIVTLTDDSRIESPGLNYLGEKNEGDRRRKIRIHIWYPAKTATGKRKLLYSEYCYNYLQSSTLAGPEPNIKIEQLNNRRRSVEGWFGKTSDADWNKLINTSMMATADAEVIKDKFPLLIGTLRSLSTSITNEMLASNGYVVAMIVETGRSSFIRDALDVLPDMRFALTDLQNKSLIDPDKIGTFGFSGSGFAQVLLAMNEYRIKAVADIESGIYMNQLYQNFSGSNYYVPANLRAPFLHIFSRDLSRQEIYFSDFVNKTKFAQRYRLLLNQPGLHHWDFAAEGYTACLFLNNRGGEKNNIRTSYEIASYYLINFFNSELKNDEAAKIFLASKPVIPGTADSLWEITIFGASQRAPDINEFEYIVRKKGIKTAIDITNKTLPDDSLSNLNLGFLVNALGYKFLGEKQYASAIGIFELNTMIHPDYANGFDSLAEAFEVSGDSANMKKHSQIVLNMMNKKENLSDPEKGLKENAYRRLK